MGSELIALLVLLVALPFGQSKQQNATGEEFKRVPRQYNAFYDPYGFEAPINLPASYYNRENPFSPGDVDSGELEARAGNRFKTPFQDANNEDPQSRLLGFSKGFLWGNLLGNRPNINNNQPNPLAAFGLINPIQYNPNFPNLLTTFDSCKSPTGQDGVCAPAKVCNVFRGQPSGSCIFGGVCCVNTVPSCNGGTVTLNNTYWQSPATRTLDTCSLNIKLDSRLVEQKKPICQVRLDFISFTITGPTAGVCNIDTFQATGATNTAPLICGENGGQHMYLHVPDSSVTPSEVQLLFNFGAASRLNRIWNIRVSMLPCGANILAPQDCLQYFTSASGTVRSFNFQDAAPAIRQLANQDYNMCFRNELIGGQRATSICLTVCTLNTVGAEAYGISGAVGGPSQAVAEPVCPNDFLLFPGASANNPAIALDRLCGGRWNTAAANAASVQVCSRVRPFRLYFRSDGNEPAADTNNVGFCFDFQQRTG